MEHDPDKLERYKKIVLALKKAVDDLPDDKEVSQDSLEAIKLGVLLIDTTYWGE